jgi:hypothetical protein
MALDGKGTVSPENDEQIDGGVTVIQAINQYRKESADARRDREIKGDKNWQMYLGRQDFSHKQEGQSAEFLPKVPISVEQLAVMVKRSLVQFGHYFSVETDAELGQLITGNQIRNILEVFLADLWAPNTQRSDFPTVISDGVKQALLKSLIILKVHGGTKERNKLTFERGEGLRETKRQDWKLRIDLVRFEDYYPDPTGAGLYEIHRVERDLHEVVELSEGDDPIYDPEMVKQLVDSVGGERPEDEELSEADRNQSETTAPSFRKKVLIDEFWGTLLDDKGRIAHRNVVATVANERFLIRPPEPNPFWHGRSPLLAVPLIRVPHSVWHKAIYDHASDLNVAINELYNLLIDGGMASVWGISQLRVEDLEDPSQVEGGIRQGMTLAVKQTLPHNAKVYERVSEGNAPVEATAVFESLNREFSQAAMTNELKLGSLPPKQVLATEILESGQGQSLMLDGIVADIENALMSPALEMSFQVIMQMAEKMPAEVFNFIDDKKVAVMIMRASPEERFALFFGKCKFKVHGLSSTMARAMEFQKIMAFLQAITVSPLFLQAFMKRFSPDRFIDQIMATLNLNPTNFEKTEEEIATADAEMQATAGAQQMMTGGGQETQAGGVASGPAAGGDSQTAAIQRRAQPGSQLPGNA